MRGEAGGEAAGGRVPSKMSVNVRSIELEEFGKKGYRRWPDGRQLWGENNWVQLERMCDGGSRIE